MLFPQSPRRISVEGGLLPADVQEGGGGGGLGGGGGVQCSLNPPAAASADQVLFELGSLSCEI